MKTLIKVLVLLALALLLIGTSASAQANFTLGGSIGTSPTGQFWQPRTWNGNASIDFSWFRFRADTRRVDVSNELGIQDVTGLHTVELGFGYRTVSLLGSITYREDFAFDENNNRFAWYVGPTLDYLQPIRIDGKPIAFLQASGSYKFGFAHETPKLSSVENLPDSQTRLTARVGFKVLTMGSNLLFLYGEYTALNIGLDETAQLAGGDYFGIGLRVMAFGGASSSACARAHRKWDKYQFDH